MDKGPPTKRGHLWVCNEQRYGIGVAGRIDEAGTVPGMSASRLAAEDGGSLGTLSEGAAGCRKVTAEGCLKLTAEAISKSTCRIGH